MTHIQQTGQEISGFKNARVKKLLSILSDGHAHSGAELGESLGITRSAIWKLIHQLQKDMGIAIEAKTNQGYRIQDSFELLDLQKIKNYLHQRYHPYLEKSVIFDEIPSTNSYLLKQIQNHQDDAYICLAEMQTAGRGKFNRRWISPFGHNIYLSLLWNFSNNLPQLSGLSLAVAVAVMRSLKKCGVTHDISVKWPNDFIWQGRKLGGVLIDLCGEFNYQCHAVIGIGLNLYLSDAFKAVDFPATDLAEITHSMPKRNQLLGVLIEDLLDSLAIFQKDGLAPFIAEFTAVNSLLNKSVQISVGNNVFYGVGRGIDKEGYFLLEDAAGKVQRFSCGEASLRAQP